MLTTSRLFLLGGTLVLGAAFARCDSAPTNTNPATDMATTTPADMATTPTVPTLSLTSVSPTNALNNSGRMMTVNGTNFLAGATVTIGGVAATNVTVVSSTQITCTIPVKVATCGPADVVVTNTDGKSASKVNAFTYQSASLGFAAPASLTMGANPRSLTIADIDEKNGPDLITANSGAATVAVRLNDGTGNFTNGLKVTDMVKDSPFSVAVGYLDGDTNLDLAVVMKTSSKVKVRLGNKDGTFNVPADDTGFSVGANPFDIVIGDLDGVTKADLVVANSGSANLSVLLNQGNGTFMPQKLVTITNSATAMVLGNFDNDAQGTLDIAYTDIGDGTNGNGTATMKIGKRDGTFGLTSMVLSLNAPTGIAAGDFDGDGFLDLVLANRNTTSIRVAPGSATGQFGQGSTPNVGTMSLNTNNRAVAVGDFNQDGFLDIAVANNLEKTVDILLRLEGGGFMTKINFPLETATDATRIAVADLNKDNIPDIVTNDVTAGKVTLLMSQCK